MVRDLLFRFRQYPAMYTPITCYAPCMHSDTSRYNPNNYLHRIYRQKRNLKHEKYLFQQCCHIATLHWHAPRCLVSGWVRSTFPVSRIEFAPDRACNYTSVSSLQANQLVASESQRARDHGQSASLTPPVNLSFSFLSRLQKCDCLHFY